MIEDVRHMFFDMLKMTWPMVVISVVILVSLRITYLIKNKRKLVLYKELFMLFFVMYILCLFQIVTFQDVSWGGSNFIPFKEILRYRVGSSLFYRNIFGNMLLFMPYGFFTAYYLKLKKPGMIIFLTGIASATIESTQLIIGRVFDIDDIILNILGGLVGYLIYYLLEQLGDKLPRTLHKDWFLNILAILLIIGLGCVLFL